MCALSSTGQPGGDRGGRSRAWPCPPLRARRTHREAPGHLGQPAHCPALLPRPRASSLCSSQSFAVRGQKQGKGFTVSQGVPACEAARLLLCEGVLTPLSLAAVNTLPSHCSLRHPAATVLRPESQERPSGPPAPRPRSGHLLALPQPGPRAVTPPSGCADQHAPGACW